MWEIIIWILLFIGSYLIIYFAADFFLDNLKDLCLIYKLSPFIIGMLVLGIDPEESIASVIASINGLPYLSMGNVIGNSIIAMTLPFALPLLTKPLKFKSISSFYFKLLLILMVMILFGFIFNYFLFFSGFIALGGYLVYFFRNFKYYKKEKELAVRDDDKQLIFNDSESVELENVSKSKNVLVVIVAFSFIFIGGELLVFSAERIIDLINIPEIFFGSIIIGFVTNVEEITLVIKSIKKKSEEIGFGGMIGKMIWNLTITYGISGLIIMSFKFNWILIWNWIILTGIIIYFYFASKKGILKKIDGIILWIIFIIFILSNSLYI